MTPPCGSGRAAGWRRRGRRSTSSNCPWNRPCGWSRPARSATPRPSFSCSMRRCTSGLRPEHCGRIARRRLLATVGGVDSDSALGRMAGLFEVMVSLVRKSWFRPALVVAVCALALAGCASKGKPKPKLAYEERPVELLYSTGADRMDRHLWTQAVDYFQEVERQHPYSEWSRRAILMQAFAHYQANDYEEAIADADRFISLYPGNPTAAYAHYIKAVCYFEQIVDVGRDQAATGQALDNLREVTQRYGNT